MPKSRTKILIIDDEPQACMLFKKIAEGWGHTVFTATSPDEGLALYKDESPHLVFLDMVMPKTSGINLLKQIMKINPKQVVIILTGYGDLHSARKAMKLGAYDYVSKPLETKLLKNSIEEALSDVCSA